MPGPLHVAFYEPAILHAACERQVAARLPRLRLVSLMPADELGPTIATATAVLGDRLLLDPPPSLIESGEIRALITEDFRATADAFPSINLNDILTWPELEIAYKLWTGGDEPSIRFYGQFDPPVDKLLYERYFTDVRGGFFIEAGASDGVEESCCKAFEEFLGWTGLNVEPSPVNFELLEAARPTAINVRAALSDHDGTATFTNALHPVRGARFGNGSLSHTPAHVEELISGGCTFETFEVETLRYDTLLARHGITNVDLFVLDVEGHELAVLQGMAGTAVWPRVFCIEHGNIGVDGLRAVLEPVGYTLDFVEFNNAYFSRSDG